MSENWAKAWVWNSSNHHNYPNSPSIQPLPLFLSYNPPHLGSTDRNTLDTRRSTVVGRRMMMTPPYLSVWGKVLSPLLIWPHAHINLALEGPPSIYHLLLRLCNYHCDHFSTVRKTFVLKSKLMTDNAHAKFSGQDFQGFVLDRGKHIRTRCQWPLSSIIYHSVNVLRLQFIIQLPHLSFSCGQPCLELTLLGRLL